MKELGDFGQNEAWLGQSVQVTYSGMNSQYPLPGATFTKCRECVKHVVHCNQDDHEHEEKERDQNLIENKVRGHKQNNLLEDCRRNVNGVSVLLLLFLLAQMTVPTTGYSVR